MAASSVVVDEEAVKAAGPGGRDEIERAARLLHDAIPGVLEPITSRLAQPDALEWPAEILEIKDAALRAEVMNQLRRDEAKRIVRSIQESRGGDPDAGPLEELAKRDLVEIWRIEEVMFEGDTMVQVAQRKTGKTILALNLCRSC